MNLDDAFSDRRSLETMELTSRSGGRTASDDGRQHDKPRRDWKRIVLIIGLGALSWVATYVGMLELIEANMGDLPLVHRVIIAFSVAMLMTMIIWLLDQLFKPHPFLTKVSYGAGYIFLSLISIGFGFGFYWKVLESRSESSRSAESAVTQVQSSLNAASTRLEQLQSTLVQLTQISNDKAEIERTKGTSCPNSKPGDGPRRKMREEDAQRFSFASKFVEGRVGAVKGDMTALDGDLVKIVSADKSTFDAKSGTRNDFMRSLGRKLDMTVTGFNAFRTDPQLRQIRADLADRAERTTFGDPKGTTVSCPDAQLQTALRGVVKAIDQLPELEKPEIAAVEGSEATIEAFRRLTTTFYGLLAFKMPPSADELRDLQKKAVQSVESAPSAQARQWSGEQGGLSKRDYVPLAVAVFVDLCLFLVSMVARPTDRLSGLVPKMQAAERGPVIQILSRFNDIHKDRQIRENFEIFRHVVFDMNGDYYVAVPLDAPPRLNPTERESLRVEAQLLANLFASFEKERIFKRSLLPTTGSIKRRLARQGSKFAGSEAFRVYKFTDGAWSDIILGAVMGAARRIEDEKRRMPAAVMRPMPNGPMHGPVAELRQGPARASVGGRPQAYAPSPAALPHGGSQAPAPRYPGRGAQPPAPSSLSLDPEHAARFGPYAQAYHPLPPRDPAAPQSPRVPRAPLPPHPEAEVTVKAANSNTAPAGPLVSEPQPSMDMALTQNGGTPQPQTTRDYGVVVPLPRAQPHDLPRLQPHDASAQNASTPPSSAILEQGEATRRVDVTMSRETATFSVPVSEAVMPEALKAAVAKVQLIAAAQAVPKANQLELGLLAKDVGADGSGYGEAGAHDDLFTAEDIALIGRMAPPAAE